MRRLVYCFVPIFFGVQLSAQIHKPIKVLLLGTFHFDNPGLDVAKFHDADIFSAKRQQEIAEVIKKIKTFAPDKIFVESPSGNQMKIDSALTQYKEGKLSIRASEVQQLGYRLAKELSLRTVYGVDFRDASFPFDSLIQSAADAGQLELISRIKNFIDSIQTAFNESLKKYTIREMLLRENSVHNQKIAVGWYFSLLTAGKPGDHVGSYLTSEWWRRNMVIYENILKTLTGKEEKILIIFGSEHTALLNEMMWYNADFEIVPVDKVL
ncbi:MAG TPA: DUF5694 domain-containing protein [Chitinophagaceae bacterium]|jgi:hypothetical protein|nr:DUF5694 domain-containing protein [Chitinophagaceae bacterium]